MTAMQPYPAYRDSGVEWLGEVPEHWDVRRLKHAVSFIGGGTPSKANTSFWRGRVPWVSPKDMTGPRIDDTADHISDAAVTASSTNIVAPGAVLVVVRSGILQRKIPVAINTVAMALNQDMKALLPNSRIAKSEYLRALIRGNEASFLREWRKHGATVESIEYGLLANSPIPLPPLPEQTAIARFLDDADRRIQNYIRAKKRLIELLEEERQATIHEAVTGRIDVRTGQPYSAYRDSGIEWLGQVPEHWEVRRNVWLFRERNETGLGSLPVLEVSIREGVRIRDMDNGPRKQQILDRSQYKLAHKGDIAYNTMRMWQGAVGVVPEDGLVSPAYVVANPVGCTESRYYGYVFRTGAYQHATKLFSRGIVSDRDRLYWDDFKRLASPVPPPSEETGVVDFLDHAVRRIRAAISANQRQIALLREYRPRLIADVVTGKLDVRKAVAQLPDEDAPVESDDRKTASRQTATAPEAQSR